MAVELTEDLVEFIESGVSMIVGTRDAALKPECTRAVGAKVATDRRSVTVFLNEAVAAASLRNVEATGCIAVTFCRVFDHRTIQLKGSVEGVRPGTDEEQSLCRHYLSGFAEALYAVGLPRALVRRVRISPGVAVTFRIEEAFLQTPGPGAGRRYETGPVRP